MKIISVTIKNLNSIRGEHTIDFVKNFSKHGLFLLTGDTGSGKSTVLDAMSVALYGETPRLKSRAELEQLISIGEKESIAEVEFMVGNTLYKSSWKINIAKTGKVNPAKRELSRYDGTEFKIIAEKSRGFNDKIEEITNLNFDRFTKTVMLAQGSFDAFLQAQPQEKSELLEKITGTQIYQKISQRVYENYKQESEKLVRLSERVDDSKILNEQELQEQKSIYESSQKESKVLLEDIKNIQEIIKSVENIKKYKEQEQSLTKEKADLVVQKEAFKEDDKRLERALKAKEIYRHLMQESVLLQEIEEKSRSVVGLKEENVKLEDDLKQILKEQEKSDESLVLFKEYEKSQLRSIESAQELVIHQANIEKSLEKNNIELKQKERFLLEFLKKVDEETKRKTKEQQSLQKIEISSLSLAKETKSLEESLQQLENQVAKIDNDKLFEEKNRVENRLKKIQESIQLQEEKSKQTTTLEKLQLAIKAQEKNLSEYSQSKEGSVQEIEKLEALQRSALSIQSYEESRKNLKPDEECPLCGSLEHPFLINMPKFNDTIETDLTEAKSSLKRVDASIKKEEKELNKTTTNIEVTKATLKTIQESLEKLDIKESDKKEDLEKKLLALEREIKNNATLAESYKKSFKELEKSKELEQESKEKSIKLQNDIKLIESNIVNLDVQRDTLNSEINKLKFSIKKSDNEIIDIKDALVKILGLKTVNRVKKELEIEADKLNKSRESLKKSIDEKKNKATVNKTTLENFNKSIIELKQKLKELQIEIERFLVQKDFKDRNEVIAQYIEDEEILKDLQVKKKVLENKTVKLETLLKSTKESLELELQKKLDATQSLEELSQKEDELTLKRDEINKNVTVIEEHLKQSEAIKKEQEKILTEIETQKYVLLPWEILNKLIGSATGATYQKFVQNLTLGHLLSLANQHLKHLSDRYTLVKTDNEKLDISIVDGYYLDAKRGIKTLSGGERFLVSLSLALGLSDLVNDKIKVDSLFLDEGFGTLDEESLDMAIEALEILHEKGKIIGIISHIALLKERIYAQIQIKKKSTGSSEMVVVS